MRFIIRGKNIEVTDGLKNAVESSLLQDLCGRKRYLYS